MAVCGKCGQEVQGDAKFCKTCGTALGRSEQDEKRKRVLEAEAPSRRTPFIVAGAAVVLAVCFFVYSSHGGRAKGGMMPQAGQRNDAPATAYAAAAAVNGEIRIPEGLLESNRAQYFSYKAGGREIKFFALRAEDGSVRVALDACSACYHARLGYRQEGGAMVCNNCGMAFRSTDVGKVTGGCSPIPVEKRIESNTIVLKTADLEAGAKYF